MVPIIELRGAIPIAEGFGLNLFLYYPIAIIGNMLPVPVIYLFARKVLEFGKDKKIIGKFFTWCIEKGEKGGEKLRKSAGNKGIFWALLIFVGIPLPGTGAWTGTLAASFLKLDFKTSISAVALGVLLAGIIMSCGSKLVSILGWFGVIAIVAVILVIILISIFVKKKKK
ncbi:MAG: small multidrug export protein [Clostridiales bacterium]|nr:small multidrug export protein [Clostridiales bacterium]